MQMPFVNLPPKTLQRLPAALGTKTKIFNKTVLALAPAPVSSLFSCPLCPTGSSPAKPTFLHLHLGCLPQPETICTHRSPGLDYPHPVLSFYF